MQQNRNQIKMKIQKELFVESGGECSIEKTFLIKENSIIAEIAHIESYSLNGPRANPNNLKDNSKKNLMLVTPVIHKVIDDKANEENYPKEKLEKLKSDHIKAIKTKQQKIKKALANDWYLKRED